jgi:hypothetical protein
MSSTGTTECALLEAETEALCSWQSDVVDGAESRFEAAKELSTRLGAHLVDEHAEVGFWTPELLDQDVPADEVYLEVLTPTESVDLRDPAAELSFSRDLVPTKREGEFTWAAVEGLRPGTRDQLGSLYQLVYERDGERRTITDPVAYSLPFGVYSPPEFYDVGRLDEERADREYFQNLAEEGVEPAADFETDEVPRFEPANSMLEIHPGTATESGSLKGLADLYEQIDEKQRAGEELTPHERNFVGYDGIQLMPIEPITAHETDQNYWEPVERTDDQVTVAVEKPDKINWGYDVVVSGFSAVNPSILETGRPDELVDFIETVHNLPRPIEVVFDVALGHADNGAVELLNDYYFSGPDMYGKGLEYRHPVVRAVLLEMQRRKMDFGADGIRVDGAQDFTNWDPEAEEEWHDDEFLAAMDDVTQEVAGQEYKPWMIYEDGRPWPREDWELASTYRTLIEQHPHSFQWGPISFAHNTPAVLTFWATKWWRVREIADFGENWISGVANHDTIRRGTQIDTDKVVNQSPINPYLGETYPDILDNAYNNPASNVLFHGFLPGCPMDFTHANMRAPWGFIRDTDEPWNVKVVSEEFNFIDGQVRPEHYENDEFFPRLKGLGFTEQEDLRTFARTLSAAVDTSDYDLEMAARMLEALDSPLGTDLTAQDLKDFAMAWMRDMDEFCNLGHFADEQDPVRTDFDLAVREFRQDHPWLCRDLDFDTDTFDYRHPTEGTVLYFGKRRAPDDSEEVLFAANMEGEPIEVTPTELEVPDLATDGWDLALSNPDLDVDAADEPVTLENSQAVVFVRSLD